LILKIGRNLHFEKLFDQFSESIRIGGNNIVQNEMKWDLCHWTGRMHEIKYTQHFNYDDFFFFISSFKLFSNIYSCLAQKYWGAKWLVWKYTEKEQSFQKSSFSQPLITFS